jgi:sugar O-acyltransferase (sialic acid O-acetyltransferase NeuD family)
VKKILVYGSQDFGRIVRDLVEVCGEEFSGYIDDLYAGEEVLGTLAQVAKSFPPSEYSVALAIGYKNLAVRAQVAERVKEGGYELATLIHPRAYVRHRQGVAAGCLVMAGAVVDVGATLAEMVVVWPGVVVNHDSSIGANTFLSPNATICGFVQVGAGCFIGAGAVVVDHVQVPAGTFIKAGALYKEGRY